MPIEIERDPAAIIPWLAQVISISARMISPHTVKFRQIIDQCITKCNNVIDEGNQELMSYMKKKMILD